MDPPTTVPLPTPPGPQIRLGVQLPQVSLPLRRFLAAEAGGGVVLVVATGAALIWANVPGGGYETFWATEASIQRPVCNRPFTWSVGAPRTPAAVRRRSRPPPDGASAAPTHRDIIHADPPPIRRKVGIRQTVLMGEQ